MLITSLYLVTSILATLAGLSLAQINGLFQWQFADPAISISTSIEPCTPLRIVVKSADPSTNATHGTPPYYMISYAIEDTPVTTLIGTDEKNLSWTVTQPVFDAKGSSGGAPPQIITVVPGKSIQCLSPPIITPPFTVTANVTDELTTCQPWGLTIKGGLPPYNLTLAAVNSPIVSNVSIPLGLDSFTYINTADPGTQLIAAVSDSVGRWATGTPIVATTGATDIVCVEKLSAVNNPMANKPQEDPIAAARPSKRRQSIIVDVTVSLALLVVFGLACAFFFHSRKRARLAQLLPTQFIEVPWVDGYPKPFSDQSISGQVALALKNAQNADSNTEGVVDPPLPTQSSSTAHISLNLQGIGGTSANATAMEPGDVRPQRPASHVMNPDFTNFHTSSIRRAFALDMLRVFEEAVFQHQDAGRVRELPPPYVDRARISRGSSS